jgi:hypothetical protein
VRQEVTAMGAPEANIPPAYTGIAEIANAPGPVVLSTENEHAMQVIDDMCAAIRNTGSDQTLELERHAKLAGDQHPELDPRFLHNYDITEMWFAYSVVDQATSLINRANAQASRAGTSPVITLVVRTDVDGTLVPWGYETREDLRSGFVPAVRAIQKLHPDTTVRVQPFSDRPQATLDEEAPKLLKELDDRAEPYNGTLLPPISSKDGLAAERLDPSLRVRKTNETPYTRLKRLAAVAGTLSARAIRLGLYHEKAAIAHNDAHGPEAEEGTVYLVLDDMEYASGYLGGQSRVDGVYVKAGPAGSKGRGLQPLTYDDVLNTETGKKGYQKVS